MLIRALVCQHNAFDESYLMDAGMQNVISGVKESASFTAACLS